MSNPRCALPVLRTALGVRDDRVEACRNRPEATSVIDASQSARQSAPAGPVEKTSAMRDFEELVERGDQQLADNDVAGAIASYYDATAVSPRDGLAYRRLGEVFIDRKQSVEAIRLLRRATDLEPNDTEGWYLLGLAYRSHRNYHEAERALSRALAIAPTFNRALIDRATVRIELDDKRGALGDAHAACENGSMDGCEIKWQVMDGLTDQDIEPIRRPAKPTQTPRDTSAASPAT